MMIVVNFRKRNEKGSDEALRKKKVIKARSRWKMLKDSID